MSTSAEKITLEKFLEKLEPEAAADATTAAMRIDALERQVGPPSWLERNLISLSLIGLALFVMGAGALIGAFALLRSVIGLGGVTILVSVFPAIIAAYLFSVRRRTAADSEMVALNDRYFLPHGGIYFSAPYGNGTGAVLPAKKPSAKELTLRDQVEAKYDAATKGRW